MSNRKKPQVLTPGPTVLLGDIRQMIDAARLRLARAVNSELTRLYWRIGQRIHIQVLAGKRAEYGKEILPTLSVELVRHYGRGFTEKNLRRMVQVVERCMQLSRNSKS